MKKTINKQIDLTTMSIREEIMRYFKGGGIQRFTRNHHLDWYNAPQERGHQYNYRRSENAAANRRILHFGGVPLFAVRKHPDTITFYNKTLTGNDILEQIDTEITRVLKDYLGGVIVKRVDEGDKINDVVLHTILKGASMQDERGSGYSEGTMYERYTFIMSETLPF